MGNKHLSWDTIKTVCVKTGAVTTGKHLLCVQMNKRIGKVSGNLSSVTHTWSLKQRPKMWVIYNLGMDSFSSDYMALKICSTWVTPSLKHVPVKIGNTVYCNYISSNYNHNWPFIYPTFGIGWRVLGGERLVVGEDFRGHVPEGNRGDEKVLRR